jgi:hypothetical protein
VLLNCVSSSYIQYVFLVGCLIRLVFDLLGCDIKKTDGLHYSGQKTMHMLLEGTHTADVDLF